MAYNQGFVAVRHPPAGRGNSALTKTMSWETLDKKYSLVTFEVLGIERRALCMLAKHSTTELYPSPNG